MMFAREQITKCWRGKFYLKKMQWFCNGELSSHVQYFLIGIPKVKWKHIVGRGQGRLSHYKNWNHLMNMVGLNKPQKLSAGAKWKWRRNCYRWNSKWCCTTTIRWCCNTATHWCCTTAKLYSTKWELTYYIIILDLSWNASKIEDDDYALSSSHWCSYILHTSTEELF